MVPALAVIQEASGERSKLGRGGRPAEFPSGRTDSPSAVRERRDQRLLNHTGSEWRVDQASCAVDRARRRSSALLVLAACRRRRSDVGSGRRQPRLRRRRLRAGARRRAARAGEALRATGDALIPGGGDDASTRSSPAAAAIRSWSTLGVVVRPVPLGVPRLPAGVGEARRRGRLPRRRRRGLRRRRRDVPRRAAAALPELHRSRTARSKIEYELRGYPATAFYDASGELVYIKQGPYTSEAELDGRHRQVRRRVRAAMRQADNRGMRALAHRIAGLRSLAGLAIPASAGAGAARPTRRLSIELAGDDRPGDREVDRLGARRRGRRRTRRWRSSGSTRPGGLESSMREIVQDIIAAPMPVVVYVSPERRPRRVGRRLHHRGGRRRGDGSADQHRLGERDLSRRRGHRRHARREDRQRRRGVHARARRDATAATASWPSGWSPRPRT